MYLHGSFITQLKEKVTVHIVTHGNRAKEVKIGDEDSGVFFTTDPVSIDTSVNDTFDVLLRSGATINLLTRNFIPELFCADPLDAAVNIYKGNRCVFAGYIQPQAYSQGYNELYDELSLSCIDALSALQFRKYRNVGGLGVIYESIKASATQRTFHDIITEMFDEVWSGLDLVGSNQGRYLFDGSKSLTRTSDRYGIFLQMAVSELLFLEDDEDNVWQRDAVLEALLKYLNLHVVQDGLDMKIFSWETVKDPSAINWKELTALSSPTVTENVKTVDISTQNASSTDTTISIGEVFNQMVLTCRVKDVESVIDSPLDEDALEPVYSSWQKYMTELSADGNGQRAYQAFYDMVHDKPTDYASGAITDWYIQVMRHPSWSFPVNDTDFLAIYCSDGKNQQNLPNALGKGPGAAVIALGKIEEKTDHADNSPVDKLTMENYMIVSVNGNGKDDYTAYPTESSLKGNAPLAVYEGPTTGGVLSPADDSTTNYIVLSGKIVLVPVMEFTADYKQLLNASQDQWIFPGFNQTVPSRNNTDGRFYTQKYYKAESSSDTPVWDQDTARGLVPFTGTGPQEYEFKYSAIGDSTDRISKVSALACMLVIGDKCVVETGTQGQPSDFQWRPFKERSACLNDEEYYQQCFTIGFDPKIGDKLIGTEFDFQNNINFRMGLDAKGIAIPIKKSDALNGKVRFMILGPVNVSWGEVTRRHRTWFRREKWTETDIPLMAHVSSVMMKDFEVKVYSDNGLASNFKDKDLIYMSNTHETFINKKDDITFDINSALTADERQKLGVSDSVKLSTPVDLTTRLGVISVYDHNLGEQAKPEQIYVDRYYNEYHKPRVQMEQKLDDTAGDIGLFHHYRHPAMPDKTFFAQGLSRNLIEGYADLKLKEIDSDD